MYLAVPLSDDVLVTKSRFALVFPRKAAVACPYTLGPDTLQVHGEGTTSSLANHGPFCHGCLPYPGAQGHKGPTVKG